jgi:hypothetical protein
MIQYTGIYKAMFDKGWREINGSWANPDEVNSINGGHTMTTGDKGAKQGDCRHERQETIDFDTRTLCLDCGKEEVIA